MPSDECDGGLGNAEGLSKELEESAVGFTIDGACVEGDFEALAMGASEGRSPGIGLDSEIHFPPLRGLT
jgi:hypothetical protein